MKTKSLLIALSVLGIFSSCKTTSESNAKVQHLSPSLANREYCREVQSGSQSQTHCIRFLEEQKVEDNGSTFFGNPPEFGSYQLTGSTLTLTLMAQTGSYEVVYQLSSKQDTITGEAGAVLTLVSAISLEGKKFCRTIQGDGMMGQPAGESQHCIEFTSATSVVDDGSSSFGNPPEQGTYQVSGSKITMSLNSVTGPYEQTYTLSRDGKSIEGEAGALLTLEMGPLAGKAFCRTVKSNGQMGQPKGERSHCIEFKDETNVVDNGNTFFGNPPQTGTYTISGLTIRLSLMGPQGTEEKTFKLSKNGKAISQGDMKLEYKP